MAWGAVGVAERAGRGPAGSGAFLLHRGGRGLLPHTSRGPNKSEQQHTGSRAFVCQERKGWEGAEAHPRPAHPWDLALGAPQVQSRKLDGVVPE